jgi:hypothetical protein
MFVFSHPDPIAFSLGPLHVRWYGLMYLLGFLGGWFLARRRAAQPGSTWTPTLVDDLIFFCAVGVIAGGRLGWMLFYGTERILAEPLSVFRIWEGGMSFHGGLLGVTIALALFARSRSSIVDADFTAPRQRSASAPGIGTSSTGVWGPTDAGCRRCAVACLQLYRQPPRPRAVLIIWWFTLAALTWRYGLFRSATAPRFAVEFIACRTERGT